MTTDRPIGYWLKLVDRLIDESFDDVFQHSGLTRRHWQVLNTIRDGVGDETAVDGVLSPFTGGGAGHASAVSAEVDDLVRRGWVARGETGLTVTVAGNHAYHDLLDAVSRSRERIADGVTREQYETTLATLQQMARNLGRSD
ncbi:MarR family transcriptional regulator [Cellulosimicrobium terreum]|nr:MarR family transcriptional regulator [Cellulosimicrobium terreum]